MTWVMGAESDTEGENLLRVLYVPRKPLSKRPKPKKAAAI